MMTNDYLFTLRNVYKSWDSVEYGNGWYLGWRTDARYQPGMGFCIGVPRGRSYIIVKSHIDLSLQGTIA